MKHNLLILGAGQYSFVVREIAEATGEYERIAFLDDKSPDAVGKLEDYPKFLGEFDCAVVSIGNNRLRRNLLARLREAGYRLPALVHPRAYVSPSATVGDGSIIEPFAVVQSNASIGVGCILSATAVVNHNAVIGDGVHCDCGTITAARSVVPAGYKVRSGAVFYAAVQDDGEGQYPDHYNADFGM